MTSPDSTPLQPADLRPYHYLGAMTDLQIQELIEFAETHLRARPEDCPPGVEAGCEKVTPFDRHWGKGVFIRDYEFTDYVQAALFLRRILEESAHFQRGLVG